MKVTVRFTLEVPDGTDPQCVLEVAQRALDDDDGLLCQWGNWEVGVAELVPPEEGDWTISGAGRLVPPGAVTAELRRGRLVTRRPYP